LKANAGSLISVLQNFNPPLSAMSAYWSAASIGVISGTQLNGKNVVTLSGAGASDGFLFPGITGPLIPNSTVFAVFNATNVTPTQAIVSGPIHSLAFSVSGGSTILVEQFVAVRATSTAVLANNTWYQANGTYVASTGVYAFRIASAAQGSGTAAASTITAASTAIGVTPGASQNFAGSIAEIIVFDRILTGGEISAIETYLLAKWGV
jgi:hypothetical protein